MSGKSIQKLKYPKEDYIGTDYFGPDEEIKFRKEKLVKCRKHHTCCGIACKNRKIKPVKQYAKLEPMPFINPTT